MILFAKFPKKRWSCVWVPHFRLWFSKKAVSRKTGSHWFRKVGWNKLKQYKQKSNSLSQIFVDGNLESIDVYDPIIAWLNGHGFQVIPHVFFFWNPVKPDECCFVNIFWSNSSPIFLHLLSLVFMLACDKETKKVSWLLWECKLLLENIESISMCSRQIFKQDR